MHLHYIEDASGDLVEARELCSDACHRDYAGSDYQGWNGCHEAEHTTYCANCGVVIPGSDACEHQRNNVIVNRFHSDTGEKCACGQWIQQPSSYLSAYDIAERVQPNEEADAFISEGRDGYSVTVEQVTIARGFDTERRAMFHLWQWCEEHSYWPETWSVNERGNTTLLVRTDNPNDPYTYSDISYV